MVEMVQAPYVIAEMEREQMKMRILVGMLLVYGMTMLIRLIML